MKKILLWLNNKIIIGYVILILALLLYSFNLKNRLTNLKKEYFFAQNQFEIVHQNNSLRNEFEGKYVWDISSIEVDHYKDHLKSFDINGEHLFLAVNIIDCYSCFSFHVNNILELIDIGVPLIAYTPRLSDIIKSHIHMAHIIPITQNYSYTDAIFKYNFTVSLIDKNGRIIYANLGDQRNYDESKVFYNRLSSWFEKM